MRGLCSPWREWARSRAGLDWSPPILEGGNDGSLYVERASRPGTGRTRPRRYSPPRQCSQRSPSSPRARRHRPPPARSAARTSCSTPVPNPVRVSPRRIRTAPCRIGRAPKVSSARPPIRASVSAGSLRARRALRTRAKTTSSAARRRRPLRRRRASAARRSSSRGGRRTQGDARRLARELRLEYRQRSCDVHRRIGEDADGDPDRAGLDARRR